MSTLLLIGLISAGLYIISTVTDSCQCVKAHELNGDNYIWLKPEFGTIKKIEFEEPVGSGNWRDYEQLHKNREGDTVTWWFEHCKAVSHNPENLKEAHMKAFVLPGRFANLKFIFEDGSIYYSDRDSKMFSRFYDLEAEYFRSC